MTKRKAPTKTSSTKKKTSERKKSATSQPIRAPPQPIRAPRSTPPIIDLVNVDDPIFLEDDVAVDKNPSLSPRYTVSHAIYLDEKVVEEDSNVYQLDKGIKSFVWRT